MKLEVGMYVRTKRDGIGKILSFELQDEEDYCFIELPHRRTGIKFFNIVEASYNIIDLIEVGDLLFIDIDEGFAGGIIVPRIAETQNELEKLLNRIGEKGEYLKSILTHEQIESMEYKI